MPAFRDVMHRITAIQPTKQVKGMMTSIGILNFATASVSLFEPIYLYTLGYSLSQIILFYLCIYILTFFLFPLGAKISWNKGYHHAILFSSPFLIIYYIALFAGESQPLFFLLAIIALSVQKMLYWPAYHAEMVQFGKSDEVSREISSVQVVASLAAVAGPLFGGLMIAYFGFPALFVISSILILISNIPIMTIPEKRHSDKFEYKVFFKRLLAREHKLEDIGTLGWGEEFLALIIWPIFIFVVMDGFTSTGAIVSSSLLLTTMSLMFIGKMSDNQSRQAVLRSGVIFKVSSWVIRGLVRTPFTIVAADTFYRISNGMVSIPYWSMAYKRARQGNVMERVMVFEMALNLGKIIVGLLAILLLAIFPGQFMPLFILAAVFTALTVFYP